MNLCGNCGLPAYSGDAYCCYGCELAARVRAEGQADHGQLYGVLCLTAVLSMIVMMLSLFLYAEDVFDVAGEPEMAWMRAGYRWASFVLATPVLVLAGLPLARRASRSMDGLIVIGATAAYLLSVRSLVSGGSAVYFETTTTALALATFGRYLEATARSQASRSLGPLLEVVREPVQRLDGGGPIPATAIEPGMRVKIEPDRVVPVDLELTSPAAEVNLAVLTGESRPVPLTRGAVVPAGAVAASALEGTALRAARDSALERLSTLARDLALRPSAGLKWADAFAGALAPVAAVLAVGVAARGAFAGAAGDGIARGLAVLLAACPCAYAIASPLVYWLALRAAFSRGVLIRTADALEALARVRRVAFDKTGTLTRPDAIVTQMRHARDPEEALALIAALEEGSPHPIGQALARLAAGVAPAVLHERRSLPGRGVEARDALGRRVAVALGPAGEPVLTRAGEPLASFALSEELRPGAAVAVGRLRASGLDVLVLSGDDASRVDAVGRALSVDARARLSPEDKVATLDALGQETAMVGDGINDAPALAGRLTGITLGSAAALAKGVASVTLLQPDLELVPWTLDHARHALTVVRRLLIAATLYNLLFVGLAAAGLLKPALAGLSMLTSSLLSLAFASTVGELDALGEPSAEVAMWKA